MKIHYLSENTPSGALVSMDYGGPSCVMVTQMLLSVTDVEPRERHGVTLTKNMHNQADDLTAERAAKLIKDLFVLHLDDDGEPDETDVLALVDLQKTARQEALKEARLAVDGEMCDEPDHACGSLQRILDDIDRLAREGV